MIDPFSSERKILEKGCGVYFLFDGDELVYIGKTTKFELRLSSHMLKKVFDSYVFVKVPLHILHEEEKKHIMHYKPKYNTEWNRAERVRLGKIKAREKREKYNAI